MPSPAAADILTRVLLAAGALGAGYLAGSWWRRRNAPAAPPTVTVAGYLPLPAYAVTA
jgi:hypothetical protein